MEYFAISDTHFLHDNIIKYCDRPQDHNRIMIKNWIKNVRDDDIVFHLGDVACSVKNNKDKEHKLKEIFKILPGKKFLIKGNHDNFSDEFYYELGFEKIDYFCYIENYSMLLIHYPLRIGSHDKENTRNIIRNAMDFVKENNIKYIVHGHIHNYPDIDNYHFNVSVEALDYTPKRLCEIYETLEKRTQDNSVCF